MIHGDGKFGGTVNTSSSDVSDDKNWGKHNTKIHKHTKNHTIHYTSRHNHSHGRKPTLLTIIQLLPGTTVINHIVLLINYFLSPGPYTHSQQEFGISLSSHWNQQESPNFLICKVFLPKWMILEYITHSHSKSATCKYRREDRMRIRSHRCTVFGSVGDSRKPVVGQWWSPGNPARTEHTYSGWKATPLPGGWNFKVLLGWKLQNSFPRGNVAAGERTLYSTGCNGC